MTGITVQVSAAPILEYKFNDSGATTASSGTAPGEYLNLVYGLDTNASAPFPFDSTTPGFAPYDFHGEAGSGVSGLASDRALDNTFAAPGPMGPEGGWAINTSSTVLQGLESFTISGWYNREPVVDGGVGTGGGIAIFFTPVTQSLPGGLLDNPPNGFGLRWNNSGTFRYDLSGNGLTPDGSANTWTDEGIWVFFAETYDATTGEMNLYRGFRNAEEAGPNPAEVTLVATMDVSSGTGELNFDPTLSVGYSLMNRGPGGTVTEGSYQFPGLDRAFDALIDNIRIDGSYDDGFGALELSTLEAYRLSDINGTPVGDANGDGWVDGLDYLLWAENFSETGPPTPPLSSGNFNGDSTVDGVDYVIWAENFGQHSIGTTVPESSTFALAALAVAGSLLQRRDRRLAC
ncbi:MAG: hypothetical protein R3C10_23265 [Pirellulales bacterium]